MRSAELFLEVVANPLDDARVRVWADTLLAEGDPRGEFVVLQLAQEQGAAHAERLQALQDKHWSAWLSGQLKRVAERAEFRRGLPAEVWIHQVPEPFLVAADWAGVESVWLLDADRVALDQPALLQALVRLPLKGLKGVTRAALPYIGRKLEELGLHAAAVDGDVLAMLPPLLKRLHVQGVKDPVMGHTVWSAPIAQRLEQISIDYNTFELRWRGGDVRLHVFVEDPPLLRIQAELNAGPRAEKLEILPASLSRLFDDLRRS